MTGPADAYRTITAASEQGRQTGRRQADYAPLSALPSVPYVCLRLPTGGGKTVLAGHAIKVARDAWVDKEFPMTIWLVPSKAIRQQTVQALKNPSHPYRQALDEAFGGRVSVFDVGDFRTVRPQDISNGLCVVVATIQALRVSDTEGRRAYATNEDLEPHFARLPAARDEGLERDERGRVKLSFVNLLHRHRPVMIVDEAHNAVTGLTREMQARVNPSLIVEFTATPGTGSNILHSVPALALKEEEMIKLPIRVGEYDSWEGAVNGAIARRATLAEAAKTDKDYIRPIVLFQAQSKDQAVTVEKLHRHLIDNENLDPGKIAVATGDQRELDELDLFDPSCPIEYIITIKALKEGWDCSFAYVFCSVSRIQSATDVEQLLGRVLRMPYAERRESDELNQAYAYLSETTFGQAAQGLTDRLVKMGFDEDEAEAAVEPVQGDFGEAGDPDDFDLQPPPGRPFAHRTNADAAALAALAERGGITVRPVDGGGAEIAVGDRFDADTEAAIRDVLPQEAKPAFDADVDRYRGRRPPESTPASRGEDLKVPRLMAWVQGELEVAETDRFMDTHDWSLHGHAHQLDEGEFAIRGTEHTFEIDLDGRRVTHAFDRESDQMTLSIDVEGWTPEALVRWLDGETRSRDVGQLDRTRWLARLVSHLLNGRGMSLTTLMQAKFMLARRVRDRIDAIRQEERGRAYQQLLFEPAASVEVSFDDAFVFEKGMYDGLARYRGSWRPSKHFLGADRVPAFDGAAEGEEVQCAWALDSLDDVEFWIRNVARHPSSFSLPTAGGRFYPDFVAKLRDGRLLVVEYKGALTAELADTHEKRVIGELWQDRSEGRARFVIAEKNVGGRDVRTQLIEAL